MGVELEAINACVFVSPETDHLEYIDTSCRILSPPLTFSVFSLVTKSLSLSKTLPENDRLADRKLFGRPHFLAATCLCWIVKIIELVHRS